MATDPKRAAILAALVTRLRTIAKGATYHYTADVVARLDPPPEQYIKPELVPREISTLIAVYAMEREHAVLGFGGQRTAPSEVFVTSYRRHRPKTANPWLMDLSDQDDPVDLIRDRLMRDVIVAVNQDDTFGGLARYMHATHDRPALFSMPDGVERWIGVDVRFELSYDYAETSP